MAVGSAGGTGRAAWSGGRGMTPLHTRMLSVRLGTAGAATLLAEGRVIDLRRRGLATFTGVFQNPGMIHDMTVKVWLDVPDLRISRIEPGMASYPFPASPLTGGESCPDQIAGVQRVVGASLRDGFGERLLDDIGGVRGCLHVFALLRFLGVAVEHALSCDARRAQFRADGTRRHGPQFARTVLVDALMGQGSSVALRGSLLDTAYGAEGPGGRVLADVLELQVDTETELPSMRVLSADGRCRRWQTATGRPSAWENADVTGLTGRRMSKGYTAAVEQICGGDASPLRDLLLALAPAAMQAMPSVGVELGRSLWPTHGGSASADFCHMWRRGGPLIAALGESGEG